MKKLLKYLPKTIRGPIVRANIPNIVIGRDIKVEMAKTMKDLYKCSRILHDAYVDCGYIKPQDPPIRKIWNWHLNTTKTFMVKNTFSNQIIATFTIFIDCDNGLPCDTGFKKEVDILRNQGRKIIEVGCLASDPGCRRGTLSIPFLINRVCIRYAMDAGMDDIILTTNPKFKMVYEDLLLSEKIGYLKDFGYISGNPAVLYRNDMRTIIGKMMEKYLGNPDMKNIYKILFCEV